MENIEVLLFESSSSDSSVLDYALTSSSSSSYSDCEEYEEPPQLIRKKPLYPPTELKTGKRRRVKEEVKEEDYYLELIKNYTDAEFKKQFRLSRTIAVELILMYTDHTSKEFNVGRKEVVPEKQIYLTLWYLASTETYNDISNRFNVTVSSVFRILHKVTNWVVNISNLYVKWPTEQEMKASEDKFCKIKKFPRVVAVMGGCHIRINCPKTDREDYYNIKEYYSMLLQGIVDADKKFIDLHCGEPGSMDDTCMYHRSNISKELYSNPNMLGPRGIILADSSYPDSDRIVTPFKDHSNLSGKKIKFNSLHSATRMVVDNTFALLKSRFRRLQFFKSPNVSFTANCTVTACVLHNMCIIWDDILDDDEMESIDSHETFRANDSEHVKGENTKTKNELFKELDNKHLLK